MSKVPKDNEDAYHELRAHAQRLKEMIGAPSVHRIARRLGKPFKTQVENFEAFCSGASKTFNPYDIEVLKNVLYRSAIGLAVLKESDEASSALSGLFDPFFSASQHDVGRHLPGTYLTYHGSHLEPGHFVVRATQIRPSVDHFLEIEDRLSDPKNLGTPVRIARGLVTVIGEQPHFLTFRRDNSRGFNLIVIHAMSPEGAPPQAMNGHMFGMTKEGLTFSRAILMTRAKHDNIDALVPRTGIKTWDDWKKNASVIKAFERLRTIARPPTCFPDPLCGQPHS